MIVEQHKLRPPERDYLKRSPVFATPAASKVATPAPQKLSTPRLHDLAHFASRYLRPLLILEQERGILALMVPVVIGAGAFFYYGWPHEPSWLPVIAWIAALSAITFLVPNSAIVRVAVMSMLLFAAGFALAKLEVQRAGTKVLGSAISTRMTGYVADIEHLASGRIRLVVDVIETQRPKLRYQPDRIRVTTARLADGIVAGSLISGTVRLHPPTGPSRPGGYDFSFESYFDGIGANGYFLSAPKLMPDGSGASIFRRARAGVDNFRNVVAGRIRAAITGPKGEIAAALIVGVRGGIAEEVNESLRRTGLAHILSISGLHMALVAGIVMGSIRLILAFVPAVNFLYPSKKLAAAGALSVLSFYLFISGADVAAQRSYLMLAIMLIAVFMDREALSMRNLAVAALAVLVVSPHEIVGPSFQMSFAATAALIAAYRGWTAWRRAHGKPFVPPAQQPPALRLLNMIMMAIAGTMMTAFVAGAATSIYGIWHFQRVSSLSLLANLAVSPIVSLIIMPFAVIAAIMMPFGIEAPALWVMGAGIDAMLFISDWLSQHSPIDAVGVMRPSAVIWLTAALLVASFTTTRLKLAAVPMAIVGVGLLLGSKNPDVLISEDARLVAVRQDGGNLIVSQKRPNAFTLNNWAYATASESMVGPKFVKPAAAQQKEEDVVELLLSGVSKDSFLCAGAYCLAEHHGGGIVTITENPDFPDEFCNVSDVIVVQAYMTDEKCGADPPLIIDKRTLARQGTAQITFADGAQIDVDGTTGPKPVHAITEPYRPWHSHRAFSRAARGLAERAQNRTSGKDAMPFANRERLSPASKRTRVNDLQRQ